MLVPKLFAHEAARHEALCCASDDLSAFPLA